MLPPEQLTARRAELVRDGLLGDAWAESQPTGEVMLVTPDITIGEGVDREAGFVAIRTAEAKVGEALRQVERKLARLQGRPARRPTAPPRQQDRRTPGAGRAPRGRRVTTRSASRGDPDPEPEPPPPDVARPLPPAAVLYARAASLSALASGYGIAGRNDLYLIGVGLSRQLEALADRRAA